MPSLVPLQIGGAIALLLLLVVPTVAAIWIGRRLAERLREIEPEEPDDAE